MSSTEQLISQAEADYVEAIRNLSPEQICRVQNLSDDLGDLPPGGIMRHARNCFLR